MQKSYFLVLALIFSAMATSQTEKTQRLDSLYTAFYDENKFHGNVLVAENGEIIYQKSLGYAKLSDKTPLNLATKFELASVSKQFTALAVYLLHKQGKLDLEEAIASYIPEWDFYPDIQVQQLVYHTSGLPDYMELMEAHWNKENFATNQDIINLFAEKQPELEFAPNTQFSYSNTGYAVLAYLIEKVSKQSFADYLAENIFQPLGMKNTFVYRSKYENRSIANYAIGYTEGFGGMTVAAKSLGKEHYFTYLDGIVGDGMVNSTLEDLLLWDQALYGNNFLSEKDKNILFKGTTLANGETTDYGFGWFIAESTKYGKLMNHSGSWAGYLTFIERHIDHKKTIIVLQNKDIITSKLPSTETRNILYNEKIEVKKLVAVELTEEQLQVYIGTYANATFPFKIEVFTQGNQLMTQATGQQAIPMRAFENHVFTFDAANIELTFTPEDNTMLLIQGGMKVDFIKEN